MLNWENFIKLDKTFDMDLAYQTVFSKKPSVKAMTFYNNIAAIRPIKSRQMAALILVLMRER